MQKITLFFLTIVLCSFSGAFAQYNFTPIVGPTNVVNGTDVTINLNDAVNSTGVTAGTYLDFTVTADWTAGAGGPWSNEAELDFTSSAGSVTFTDPSSGGADSGAATTISFTGSMLAIYDTSGDTTLSIVLRQSYGGSDANWSNIAVTINPAPSCVNPNILTANNITATEADLGWTSGGSGEADWQIIVQAAGLGAPAGAGTSTAGANPYTVSSLTPATPYEFYVRADCGGSGFSSWAGPFSFTTLCSTFTPDYTNDFTSYPGSCWEEGDNTDIATGPNNTNGAWTSDGFLNVGFSGAAKINLYNTGDSDWLVSPTFDLSAGGYELKFDVGVTEFAGTAASAMDADDEVQVLISNDSGTTWINLETFDAGNTPSNTGDSKTYDLTGYVSTTTKFAFWATEGATGGVVDFDFFIDNFVVRTIPACSEPTALTVDNFVGPNSADISWTAAAGAVGYNWEIQPQGTAQGTAGAIDSGTTSLTTVTTTSLVNGASYTLYVQSDCGGPTSIYQSLDFTYILPPANDNLCNAIALTLDTAAVAGAYTNDSATEETSEPAGACYTGGAQGTVWFSFVAPASGEVQISTDIGGTMTDSEIAVYDATGVTCADLSTLGAVLACDQDSGTVVGSGYMNVLDMTAANGNALTPGTTYYVQVSGYSNDRGTFGIQVFDQVTLSIDNFDIEENFRYYPNPVQDRLTISAQNNIEELSIVNMLGQVVKTVQPNVNNYELNFTDLNAGVYFVKATINNTEGTFRIIKK